MILLSRLTLYNDSSNGTITLSYQFIDEYMKDCNDAQLKVYLYLLRMLDANLPTSISDMADQFNYTEKDVIRALKHWEQLRLLHLDYNDNDTIVGIHVQSLKKLPPAEILPMKRKEIKADTEMSQAHSKADGTNSVVETSKRTYSADEIIAFKQNEEFSEVIFVSENYLQHPLTPSEIQVFLFIYDTLHFSADLVGYLVEYCVEHNKTSHLYIERVAIDWANANITTVDQAKLYASQYDKSIFTIMNAVGNYNAPTKTEVAFIRKWRDEYAFSTDIILKACEKGVIKTTTNRFAYIDGILSSWYKANVHTLSDIDALDAAFAQKTKNKQITKSDSKAYQNTFNQFEQRSYDYAALEKALLSN